MENASKALIIAGTILLVLMIISIGMVFFGKLGIFSGTVESNLSDEQINTFNNKFLKYDGTQKGSRIKELITAVNKNNSENETQVTINDSDFVTSSGSMYYPTANLINSNIYTVRFERDDNNGGIITVVNIGK